MFILLIHWKRLNYYKVMLPELRQVKGGLRRRFKGRCISISAGPLDKWKDFETWVPDSKINGVKERDYWPIS